MSKISLHCGGVNVDLPALAEVEVPEMTSTYKPVPHYDLAETVKKHSMELLRMNCVGETYALAKDGARMFGLQTFNDNGTSKKCAACKATGWTLVPIESDDVVKEPCMACNGTGWAPDDEYGFSVAFRNSYDKSMSLGLAAGFKVFICDNLAISGEINIMRKHTGTVWDDVENILITTLFKKGPGIRERFATDVHNFKQATIDRARGWQLLGHMLGGKILSITQASQAYKAWNELEFNRDTGRNNVWQLYNVCTEALKSTPVNKVMEVHRDLHQFLQLEAM